MIIYNRKVITIDNKVSNNIEEKYRIFYNAKIKPTANEQPEKKILKYP